jgi:hypothetical protein
MDIDEVMKETFSAILVDAKLERSIVIQVIDAAPKSLALARYTLFRIKALSGVPCRHGQVDL